MADKDFVVKNGIRTVSNTFYANNTQIALNSNLVINTSAGINANGSYGSVGQVLVTNGSGVYWYSIGAIGVNTSAQYVFTNTVTFSNSTTFSNNIIINSIYANSTFGTAGQVLTTGGTGANAYWVTPGYVNTSAQYTYTNNMYFTNSVTFSNNIIVGTIYANTNYGTAGQVLTSAGSGTNVYWSTLVGVNTAQSYAFTNTVTFSNTITTNGGIQLLQGTILANGTIGTAGYVLASGGAGTNVYWRSATATVAGGDTQVQFNDGGTTLGASGGFTFNKTTNNVTIANTLTVGSATVNNTIYTGTANNASYLGTVAAANYVTNTGNFTLSGSITHTGATVLNGAITISNTITASGSTGSTGQFLTSSGSTGNSYWSSAVTSVSVTAGQLAVSYSGVNPTLGLATTSVTPGSYTLSSITVDAYGRITSASNGSAGSSGVTSVAAGTNITVSGTGSGPYTGAVTVNMATGGAGAGTYPSGSTGVSAVTIDAYGRVTGVSNPASPYATQSYVTSQGYLTSITSGQVTTALGYTPYNSTNPSGYITNSALSGYATQSYVTSQGYLTSITSGQVTTALGYTPYNGSTNPNGYLSSITSSQVTTALGYTPYNAGSSTVITSTNYSSYLSYAPVSGSSYYAPASGSSYYAPAGGSSGTNWNCNNLYAAGDVYASYSDVRLKTNIRPITGALDKVNSISGVYYNPSDVAIGYGFDSSEQVGVIAQEIKKVLPQIVKQAPFDTANDGSSKSGEKYITVQYEKIVPLLIEAIKELSAEVESLKNQIRG